MPTFNKYQSSPECFPSITIAAILILANFWGKGVPAFASFIPPVRGDLPPTEILPEEGAIVPVTNPGASISLLFGPNG